METAAPSSQATTFEQLMSKGVRIAPFTGLEQFGDVKLWCRSISEKESAEYESSLWKPGTAEIDPTRLKSSRRKLLAMTVCDENGNKILTEEQASTLDSLLADILHSQAEAHTRAPRKKN